MKSAVFAGALALAVVALGGLSHAQSESAPQPESAPQSESAPEAAPAAVRAKPKQTTIMYRDQTVKSGAEIKILSDADSARNKRNKVIITMTRH